MILHRGGLMIISHVYAKIQTVIYAYCMKDMISPMKKIYVALIN